MKIKLKTLEELSKEYIIDVVFNDNTIDKVYIDKEVLNHRLDFLGKTIKAKRTDADEFIGKIRGAVYPNWMVEEVISKPIRRGIKFHYNEKENRINFYYREGKKIANKDLEYLKLWWILKKEQERSWGSEKIDWTNGEQRKYSFYMFWENIKSCYRFHTQNCPFSVCFKTANDRDKVIKKYEDRILKVLK